MPTVEPKTGLNLPLISDDFDAAELHENLRRLTDFLGEFICTSSTRPSWTGAHAGLRIYESDTGATYRWSGSSWTRIGPFGHLVRDPRTSDLTVTSGNYTTVAQANYSLIGGRDIQISAAWYNVTGGAAEMCIKRGSTVLMEWVPSAGGGITVVDSVPSAGSTTYYFQVRNTAATTTVKATSDHPATIDLTEV